jgi:3-oxoacyl-[acyl-carrier protein] reductase
MLSRDPQAIRAAAERIRAETGGETLGIAGDIAASEAISRWHEATRERFGGVDLLFTNSGGPPPGPILGFSDDDWRHAFDLLVLSALRAVRTVVPSMVRGGSILLSTSSSVRQPIPNLGLSNILRLSVAGLAKNLALELAPQRIRVNQIIPGRIDTDRVRELDQAAATRVGISITEEQSRSIAAIPLGRYGAAEEFGRAAAFLLSDAASYITGATLQVDGGLIRSIL